MSVPEPSPLLEQLIGQPVVLDVASLYIYLGTLSEVDHKYLILTDADVHDLRDTTTTRELYVLDSKRHGLSVNRKRVLVNRHEIVSISALADVIE
ncbi:MAG: hypothetical protein KDA93_10915 [Planctomycetaceae bacterium]|nr:hypothetical protein [Planctomycetaceae bacterium]